MNIHLKDGVHCWVKDVYQMDGQSGQMGGVVVFLYLGVVVGVIMFAVESRDARA